MSRPPLYASTMRGFDGSGVRNSVLLNSMPSTEPVDALRRATIEDRSEGWTRRWLRFSVGSAARARIRADMMNRDDDDDECVRECRTFRSNAKKCTNSDGHNKK